MQAETETKPMEGSSSDHFWLGVLLPDTRHEG
jgi:hypothetical protein